MVQGIAGLRCIGALVAFVGASLWTGAALAAAGHPTPWQLGFQDSVTAISDQIHSFHNLTMVIITLITLFVLGLLVFAMMRFNARANPTPSKSTHNTLIEVLWTVIPIIILVLIAVPSFKLLYAQYDVPKPDLTIKAIGHQWYWSYEYPDQEEMSFDSVMVEDGDLKPDQPRLLSVDNEVVVPVNKNVLVLVTADDVIHNCTIPSFGSKVDAVPGRVTSTWFNAREKGIYYGQCSELCGIRHAFMPIAVRVVDEEVFNNWAAAMAEDEDKARAIIQAAVEANKRKTIAELKN